MPHKELGPEFVLALRLLEHKNYPELTHQLVCLLLEYEGIEDVACYEIFSLARASKEGQDFSSRRFPVSLDDNVSDEYTQLIDNVVQKYYGGVHQLEHDNQAFLVFDICEGVKPRRLVIAKGNVLNEELNIITGLFCIYERLVILLDSKERDNLTHLRNRQTMDVILAQVFDFYQKKDLSKEEKFSWLAILDLDHFKEVNDTFGHLYGDEVLITFSRLMEKSFRHTDFIFRYGGEEFLVIVNRATKEQAEKALQRFRKSVEDYDFSFGKVTVSIGFTFLNPEVGQRSLLELADSALYGAKNKGRNQVVYNDLQDSTIENSNDVELF
ncbi:GGDEF domain-containing protein [Oceaniserpentilla sp. 4NH20-0058]|uniref:GGDEF domain-containing protein n=1 Tax=Oceaniserpentilla sp. 4NH20-0058 TaxID=3127660 RepID=UPI003103820C